MAGKPPTEQALADRGRQAGGVSAMSPGAGSRGAACAASAAAARRGRRARRGPGPRAGPWPAPAPRGCARRRAARARASPASAPAPRRGRRAASRAGSVRSGSRAVAPAQQRPPVGVAVGLPVDRLEVAAEAVVVDRLRHEDERGSPARCARTQKSMSSMTAKAGSNSPAAAKTSRRNPSVAPPATSACGGCGSRFRWSCWAIPRVESVHSGLSFARSIRAATKGWRSSAAPMAASQPGATASSASQKRSERPRAARMAVLSAKDLPFCRPGVHHPHPHVGTGGGEAQ